MIVSNIDEILKDLEIDKINGILFDLGVSSPQFDKRKEALVIVLMQNLICAWIKHKN